MNLEQAARQLIRTIAQHHSLDEQLDAQNRLKKNQPTALGMTGLLHLEGLVTREASDGHGARGRGRGQPRPRGDGEIPAGTTNSPRARRGDTTLYPTKKVPPSIERREKTI
jgi:hypothetical protein